MLFQHISNNVLLNFPELIKNQLMLLFPGSENGIKFMLSDTEVIISLEMPQGKNKLRLF